MVALVALGAGLALCQIARDEEEIRLKLDPNAQSQTVHIYYFAVGEFGGLGGSLDAAKDLDAFLPTYFTGRRAKSLRAIVYARGCEIATFALDPLPPGPSQLQFACRKLGTVWLRGVVTGHPRPSELRIRLDYVGSWSPRFFGFGDGPALMIHIADAVPDQDGRFAVEVPDFARDPVTRSHQENACWWITASGPGSNERYHLKPDRPATFPWTLAFEPEYPKELQFKVERF
jgi:hypothetical protein